MRTLDSFLVPSRLIEKSEFRKVPIAPQQPESAFWYLSMLRSLIAWLAPILWMRLWGRLTTEDLGRRLRMYLEEMGGLWIKVGQLLSLRRDLFPPSLCEELSKLLDRTAGFDFATVRRIVEADLGAPIEHVFDHFGEEPFAAASIGQTHRAHLRSEDVVVAVKVQRPGVEQRFRQQMTAIRTLSRVVEWTGIMPHLRPSEIVAELSHIMTEELDYRMEGSNILRMRRTLKRHGVYVPKVFTEHSSPRVLVMEFVHGVLMSDYIQVVRTNPERAASWALENNVEPEIAGRRLYHSLLRQIFEDNLFHGDLHPGNIILLRNSRIAFIDFGTVGFMESDYQRKYQLFLRSVARQEYTQAVDLIFLLASTLPPIDLQEIREECIRILRSWEARTVTSGLPYHQKSVSIMYQQLLMVMHKYKVRSTWLFLKIDRAALTLDASLMHLIPEVDFPKLLRAYFRKAERRQLKRSLANQTPGRVLSGVLSVAEALPEMVYEFNMFQAPMFRRQAVTYEGSLSKLDKLFSVFLGELAAFVMVAIIVLATVFAHQYYPARVAALVGSWIGILGDEFPRLSIYAWAAVLFFLYFGVYRKLTTLKRRFSETDARLPRQ